MTAKIGEMTLTGQSGGKYTFNVYPSGTEFNKKGGVYYISKRTKKSSSGGSHSAIYVGKTKDLSERFDDHHKADCFERNGINAISIFAESNEQERLDIESDLIASLNPPCND